MNASEAGGIFAGVIFTVWLQSLDVKTNQENLNKSMEANRQSLEIMALSALIQEADCALLPYERWEKSDNAGDYKNAKAKVRESLSDHRVKLEKLLKDLEST